MKHNNSLQSKIRKKFRIKNLGKALQEIDKQLTLSHKETHPVIAYIKSVCAGTSLGLAGIKNIGDWLNYQMTASSKTHEKDPNTQGVKGKRGE